MGYGLLKCYDGDPGAERGVLSYPTPFNVALTQQINPTGSPIMMTRTQASSDVVPTTLSVAGDGYAPNIYNKDPVEGVASTKQSTPNTFNAV